MSAKSPEPAAIERTIAEQAAAAKLRLRFDKSVVRLVGGLKAALDGVVPEDQTVVFTVTAPIKVRAKTAAALESLVRGGLPDGELRSVIHGNDVRVRRVTGVSAGMPRVLGFVHNPESDADLILALAEARLLGRN
ncbi:MAG TPA: hypothetical protein VHZ26_14810 [Caulobacteraceae bacterium]|jgi:hypothetical protein|nr:hypothetical protein [Caulobacteraceae bacterium]